MQLTLVFAILCTIVNVKSGSEGKRSDQTEFITRIEYIDLLNALQENYNKQTKLDKYMLNEMTKCKEELLNEERKHNLEIDDLKLKEVQNTKYLSKEINELKDEMKKIKADLQLSDKTNILLTYENERLRKEIEFTKNETISKNPKTIDFQPDIHNHTIISQVDINQTILNSKIESESVKEKVEKEHENLQKISNQTIECSNKKTTNKSKVLYMAAKKGSIEEVRKLLQNGEDANGIWVHSDNEFNFSALECASLHGHTEVATLLVEFGAFVNIEDNYGDTPLIDAARRGHVEIIKMLLGHGAHVNHLNRRNQTASYWAAFWGHADALKVLIAAGADVNITTSHWYTPLSLAFGRNIANKEEIISILKAAGATQ